MEGCREPRAIRPGGGGSSSRRTPWWKGWRRKYVVSCLTCGCLSVLHGVVFIVIYLLLRSYTSSLQFFETIPTYVPGIVFIITGLIVMCFMKRKNRYAFLMKTAGGCCGVCALLCVVCTVCTTVHMSRLQTLHECVYTPQSRTCMCVSAVGDTQEAHRFVFGVSNCEVVHGSLHACLRALFSFSVLGILLCIATAMLLYQLAAHERKRKYWEQLEVRRRFLCSQRQAAHRSGGSCGCYDEFYPWSLWDVAFDCRFLPDEPPALRLPEPVPGSDPGWNWLPWPRGNRTDAQNLPNRSTDEGAWRSECIHIFRQARFGARHHRRTRSNDGVFHHLHVGGDAPRGVSSIPCHPYPNCEVLPRCFWGPPPPYSRPVEELTGPPSGRSSKASSPPSERRFVCPDFTSTSNGIALAFGAADDKQETCVVEVHALFNTLQSRGERHGRVTELLQDPPIPLDDLREVGRRRAASPAPPIRRTLAQSMPNLRAPSSLRSSSPSSGHTSPDLDLDDDLSSPFVLCSPASDGAPFPDDDRRAPFRTCAGAAFSDDSSSASCDLTTTTTESAGPKCRTYCPFDCAIRHLHRYRPDVIEVRGEASGERGYDLTLERRSDFVVTIKGVNT